MINIRDIFGSIISVIISGFFAWAGSQGGPIILGLPGLLLIAIIGFLIHWLVFIPSYFAKTEKFFDITGTLAYLVMTSIAVYSVVSGGEKLSIRSMIVALLIIIWAFRLGLFLLIRVFDVGEDKRFQDAKKSLTKFLMFFSVSGLWVFMTTANSLTLILNNSNQPINIYFIIGLLFWITGFTFEVISDEQKRRFKKNTANRGKFISLGLWSISRHPNYFGEILIWIGMAVISFPVLTGWQYMTLISPLFVALLLTKISGVNLLEKSADEKWSHLETYQKYKKNTPKLLPFRLW